MRRGDLPGGGGGGEVYLDARGLDVENARNNTAFSPTASANSANAGYSTRAPSRGAGPGSAHTSVGDESSMTDEHSPHSPSLDVAIISAELLSRSELRSDGVPPNAITASMRARARRRKRMRNRALCALGCCGLLLLATMLTICVAFTGRALGPLAPLVVDVLTRLTGLTVADSEFTHWVLRPPLAEPTVTRPVRLLPQTGQPGASGERGVAPRPNVLIFLADDLGYSDVKAFGLHTVGHSNNTTPNIDRLAADGLMLTQFLTETICTPARAALLTGRYPARYGMSQDVLPQRVIFTPGAPTGLPKRELTLASALKASGYRTGLTGKWHLGISAAPGQGSWNGTNAFMPSHHGFDDSLVFPFSNFQKCDPYSGRRPRQPHSAPSPAADLASLFASRREIARAARRAAHDDAASVGQHAGDAPLQELAEQRAQQQQAQTDGAVDGRRPRAARQGAAATAAPDELPLAQRSGRAELRGELAAGWETAGPDADEERARLERLLGRERSREEGGAAGKEGGGRDERVESRHERREGRHLERAGGNNSALVHSAADVFAHAAGLSSDEGEYGYASNGLFCFLMANNTIVQQPADMLS